MKKPPKHEVFRVDTRVNLALTDEMPPVGAILPKEVTLSYMGDILHGVTLVGPWRSRPKAIRAAWATQRYGWGVDGRPPLDALPKWVIRLAKQHRPPAPTSATPAAPGAGS